MMSRTIVIALGGNALAPAGERPTIGNQFRHTRESVATVVELAREGWAIALVHGNGPQIGDSLARNEIAAAALRSTGTPRSAGKAWTPSSTRIVPRRSSPRRRMPRSC